MLFTLIKISSLSTQLTILANNEPEIYIQADRNRLGKGAWEKTKKNPSMMDFALHILLLETPCSSIRPSVRSLVRHVFYDHLMRLLYFSNMANSISPKILSVFLTTVRRSHGLSARRARMTKSSWPEGPLTRSWGPEA